MSLHRSAAVESVVPSRDELGLEPVMLPEGDCVVEDVSDEEAARWIEDTDPWQALSRESGNRPGEVVEVMVFRPLDEDGNPVGQSDVPDFDVAIQAVMDAIDSLDPASAPKPARRLTPPPLPCDVMADDVFVVIDLDDPDIIEVGGI